MKKDIYYRTKNLNLASYLYCNDQVVVGVNNVGKGVKEFTFVKTDQLLELESVYKWGESDSDQLLVNVRKLEQARRELLSRLND